MKVETADPKGNRLFILFVRSPPNNGASQPELKIVTGRPERHWWENRSKIHEFINRCLAKIRPNDLLLVWQTNERMNGNVKTGLEQQQQQSSDQIKMWCRAARTSPRSARVARRNDSSQARRRVDCDRSASEKILKEMLQIGSMEFY